jgi:uncharacterized membrane protein
MRRRFAAVFAFAYVVLALTLVLAASAAAENDGRGFYGATDDKVVTDAGFILIGGIPLLLMLLSIAYSVLDHRRVRRLEAAKKRRARADQRGGW